MHNFLTWEKNRIINLWKNWKKHYFQKEIYKRKRRYKKLHHDKEEVGGIWKRIPNFRWMLYFILYHFHKYNYIILNNNDLWLLTDTKINNKKETTQKWSSHQILLFSSFYYFFFQLKSHISTIYRINIFSENYEYDFLVWKNLNQLNLCKLKKAPSWMDITITILLSLWLYLQDIKPLILNSFQHHHWWIWLFLFNNYHITNYFFRHHNLGIQRDIIHQFQFIITILNNKNLQ